jgi:hypothetical protein
LSKPGEIADAKCRLERQVLAIEFFFSACGEVGAFPHVFAARNDEFAIVVTEVGRFRAIGKR